MNGLSFLLRRSLGVSGVVGLSGGANMFLGVVESPLVVRAYFDRMTRAELFQVMVLAMADDFGRDPDPLCHHLCAPPVPDAVGHMISASLISLPAALLIARLMVPGGADDAKTAVAKDEPGLRYESSIDAIVKGTMDGMQLFLAVIAVIIVVFALVALADQVLGVLPLVGGEAVSLKRVFGWLFSPFMWLLGVPWSDAQAAGGLMGTKAILNEYVAYLELAALPEGTLGPRSLLNRHLCAVRGCQPRQRRAAGFHDRHAVSRTPGRGGRVGDEKLDRGQPCQRDDRRVDRAGELGRRLMLDARLRPLIDPPLNRVGAVLAGAGGDRQRV